MIEVAIGGWSQFKGSEANIVKGLVVDTEGFIGVFDQLVNGEGGIVRLHDSVRHLSRQKHKQKHKCYKQLQGHKYWVTLDSLEITMLNQFHFRVCFIRFIDIKCIPDINKMQCRKRQFTLGDGTTEKVFMIRSGYSSLILEMSKVPMPEPVPPPKEWASWKPC